MCVDVFFNCIGHSFIHWNYIFKCRCNCKWKFEILYLKSFIIFNWNFFYSSSLRHISLYSFRALYSCQPFGHLIYFVEFLSSMLQCCCPKLTYTIFLLNLLHSRSVKYQPELGSETNRVNISILLFPFSSQLSIVRKQYYNQHLFDCPIFHC